MTSQKAEVVVSVDDEHLNQMSQIVSALRSAGMDVEQSLDTIGTISGSVDAARIENLKAIPGVAFVEQSRRFQLPPPDAEVQ